MAGKRRKRDGGRSAVASGASVAALATAGGGDSPALVLGGAPPAASVWMLSPAFDVTFFVASALATVAAWVAAERFAVPAMVVIGAVAVVSNGPHLASTWTRVYLDGHERTRRPVHYYLIPLLLTGLVVALVTIEGRHSATLRSILFYWAFWHFIAQCWGILRIYQRKAGDVGKPIAHLERVLLYLVAAAPMLDRLHTGPWSLFGSEILHPAIPGWLVSTLWIVTGVVAVGYAALRLLGPSGARVHWIRPLFVVATAVAFYVPFVLMKSNGGAAFAAAAAWHGFQYLGIVWFYNRNRWKAGVDPKARLVSWIAQPRRAVVYFLALLALVGVFYGGILVVGAFVLDQKTLGSLVWLSLTFGHYYLDGVIWKLRRPELARTLGATAAQPASA